MIAATKRVCAPGLRSSHVAGGPGARRLSRPAPPLPCLMRSYPGSVPGTVPCYCFSAPTRAGGGTADAHGSGPCVRKDVRVQIPPRPLVDGDPMVASPLRGASLSWVPLSFTPGADPRTPSRKSAGGWSSDFPAGNPLGLVIGSAVPLGPSWTSQQVRWRWSPVGTEPALVLPGGFVILRAPELLCAADPHWRKRARIARGGASCFGNGMPGRLQSAFGWLSAGRVLLPARGSWARRPLLGPRSGPEGPSGSPCR